MASMNNIDFKFPTQAVQGDTVLVRYGDINVAEGIVHLPLSTILPAIVFIKVHEIMKEDDGPRKTFATFNHGEFLSTRMVLTEKNIYKCLHGGPNIEKLWEECEGIYSPEI
jgi:hypothetical protein